MKAIRIHRYGGPEVLSLDDVPAPTPGADEVLIRTIASSLNPFDAKFRAGQMKEAMPVPLPVIPGWEASGVVESVGGSATRFKPGDAVFTYPGFSPYGAYAEYFTAKAAYVVLKPRTVSYMEAAALPMTAQTAWTALIGVGRVAPGQRVLIHGAAGGVGSIAVQLAKWRGAHVIGTGSGGSRALAESLGVDEFIDYRAAAFKDIVRDADLVLDTLGGQTQEDSWGVMRAGGILIATSQPPSPERARAAGVRAQFIDTKPDGETLEQIAALVDTGKVRPIIGAELSLAHAARAHELMQSGRAGGKIVLHVGLP
jgi:NADPH:quinone reductase-like Zn-dependent oxidoreductase